MSAPCVAIVDPYSSGAMLAGALHQRQVPCIGIHSSPRIPDRMRSQYDPKSFVTVIDHDGDITAKDLEAIGQGQLAGEKEAESRAKRMVFSDTGLLTCRLWDDLLFPGHCPDWVRTEGDLRARSAALYLFCENDLPYVPDPMRSYPTEEGRRMCRDLWQRTLEELGVGYALIHGSGEERLARAIRAVEDLLKD